MKGCCEENGISSFIDLFSRFLEFAKTKYQMYEDVLQNIAVVLKVEGFTTVIV